MMLSNHRYNVQQKFQRQHRAEKPAESEGWAGSSLWSSESQLVSQLNSSYSSTVEESWRLVTRDTPIKYSYGLNMKCPQSNFTLSAWSFANGTVWRDRRQFFLRGGAYFKEDGCSDILFRVIPIPQFLPSLLPVCQEVTKSLPHVAADIKLGPSTQHPRTCTKLSRTVNLGKSFRP